MSSSWSFVYLFFDILLSHSFFVQVNGIIFGDDEWMTPTRIPTNRAFNYNNIKYIIFSTTATKMEWIEFLVVVTRASISNLLYTRWWSLVTLIPLSTIRWQIHQLVIAGDGLCCFCFPAHPLTRTHTLRNDQLITGQFTRLGLVCLAGRCCRRCDRCPPPRRTWWSAFDPQPLQP